MEIELKARADMERCRTRLNALYGEGKAVEKHDSYWQSPSPSVPAIRVRREKSGSGNLRTLVTMKVKEVRNSIEINDEREFEVSDCLMFSQLLEMLGFRKILSKRKLGYAWRIEQDGAREMPGILGELCEVEGEADGKPLKKLGCFLELEIKADIFPAANDPRGESASVEPYRRQLLAALESAGLGEADIEEKYYSEMIRG